MNSNQHSAKHPNQCPNQFPNQRTDQYPEDLLRFEREDPFWSALAERPERLVPGDLETNILRRVRQEAATPQSRVIAWSWFAAPAGLVAAAAVVLIIGLQQTSPTPDFTVAGVASPKHNAVQSKGEAKPLKQTFGQSTEPEEVYPDELSGYLEAERMLAAADADLWGGNYDWLLE